MKRSPRSGVFYFLTELLFVILCFALCSVLCVRLFALSAWQHQLALDQNQALRRLQPIAEALSSGREAALGVQNLDENWQPAQDQPAYRIETEILEQNEYGSFYAVRAVRVRDNRVLVELHPATGEEKP